jgi:hypothetical protein
LLDWSDLPVPSFDSASFGNWDAGWRSQAPKPSDTIAINVKIFFIEFRISIKERKARSKSEKFDFQKKELKKHRLVADPF